MQKIIIVMLAGFLSACAGGSSSSKPAAGGASAISIPASSATSSANSSSANSSANSSTASSTSTQKQLHLVPFPSSLVEQNASLAISLNADVEIDPAATNSKLAVEKLLGELGISNASGAPYAIRLVLVDNPSLGQEGYSLVVAQNIVISAQTDAGLFYGVQTLRQLFPATQQANYNVPQVTINDVPQYSWRGSMVDVGRNFFGVAYLKKHIERMAMFKLNKLHLHLSDDQGWRVEIKKYPKLTSIGGSTGAGGGPGGFYTQDELKEVVAFAAQHFIEVIPELDMPGHVQAAIASYNELACDNVTNLSVYTGLDVGFSKFCLTKPEVVYPFVEDVLTEVSTIFTSQYIHIGGDEIKDDLYPEFIGKANQIIKKLNKTMIGWEEASAAQNLSTDTLLQLWNDSYDTKSAVDRNIHFILSPCSYTYLDHGNYNGQPQTYTWCRRQGIPLDRVYSFDPTRYSLVTGVEGAMWTELVKTEAAMDNRVWPRLAAIAEIAWSKPADKNYEQFKLRLSGLKPQLDKQGVQYYREPQLGW